MNKLFFIKHIPPGLMWDQADLTRADLTQADLTQGRLDPHSYRLDATTSYIIHMYASLNIHHAVNR